VFVIHEPYTAKIQHLYSGCQVFRHFFSLAMAIFFIAFTILKIAFAIRRNVAPVISISISVSFSPLVQDEKNVIKNLILLYI